MSYNLKSDKFDNPTPPRDTLAKLSVEILNASCCNGFITGPVFENVPLIAIWTIRLFWIRN